MPSIVRATVVDAGEILALQKRAYESEARAYNDWSIPPLTQGLGALVEEIEKTTVLKATERQRIVGSVRATFKNGFAQSAGSSSNPSYRGKALGPNSFKP